MIMTIMMTTTLMMIMMMTTTLTMKTTRTTTMTMTRMMALTRTIMIDCQLRCRGVRSFSSAMQDYIWWVLVGFLYEFIWFLSELCKFMVFGAISS